MFDYYVAWIISIMLLTIFYLTCYSWSAHREKKLFKHISWCLSEEPRIGLNRYSNMYNSIWSAQKYLPEDYYRITESAKPFESSVEQKLVYDILKEFYDYVCIHYFSEHFNLTRASAKFEDAEYFLYIFEEYLRYYFKSKDLFNIEITESGEQIENITPLGIVYYKLILISSLYNRSDDRTIRESHFGDTDSIIKILDQQRSTQK